jgi:ferredoxin
MADNWNFDGLIQDVLVKSTGGSCCGDISFPDTSRIENPLNPIDYVTKEFLDDFEVYLKQLGVVEISYVDGIKDYFMQGLDFDFKSAIVFSYEIGKHIHDAGAGAKAQEYNNDLYRDFGNLAYKISDYLRLRGFETLVAHPHEETIDFSHLALKAGMGAIGKSRLLISPEIGPNQKIAAILVNIKNLPVAESNLYEWIPDYCNYCSSCVRACPHDALVLDKKTRTVSFVEELCIGCSEGCTECIQIRPFYKKGYDAIFEKYKKMSL